MALPSRAPEPTAADRPPPGGWYWNSNRLARAWLPLIGPEGLGLLDYYLAVADHRPGATAQGWAAVTLDELCRLTGWGRARLVRLNRLLLAAGLLAVRRLPVAGRGPAVRRALYQVRRQAGPPTAETLTRLAALAERDPTLAARLRRYAGAIGTAAPGDDNYRVADPIEDEPSVAPRVSGIAAPVSPPAPAPASGENRSEDSPKTSESTTTSARTHEASETGDGDAEERLALAAWRDANARAATPLERQRLAQLAAGTARATATDPATGWRWVADAIAEAVEAGSAFVAPRRVARILERWQAEGRTAERPATMPTMLDEPRPDHRREPLVRPQDAGLGSALVGAGLAPARPARRRSDAGRGKPCPYTCQAPTATEQPVPNAPAEREATGRDDEPPAAWLAPTVVAGLPAAPAAVLRAALSAAGLVGEPYLRGAALAGWADAPDGAGRVLRVATPAALPPATVARLQARLGRGLSGVLGRAVAGELVPMAALVAGEARPS